MNGRYVDAVGRRTGVSAEDTRRELLDAAIAVLRERGYEGTRVSEIASRAGVTPSQFDGKSRGVLAYKALLKHLLAQQAVAQVA